MTLKRPPEEVRRWVPIDERAYDAQAFYAMSEFSDTAWCGVCGEQMHGIYGGTIQASINEHRKTCKP